MELTNTTSEESEFKDVGEKDFRKIQEKLSKVGYADGVEDGRSFVFQQYFDLGYSIGLRTGLELEKFRAFSDYLEHEIPVCNVLREEKSRYEDMKMPDSTSQEHFQYAKNTDKSLESVKQLQQNYVNEFMERCQKEMPKTTQLLTSTKKDGV